jgi:hypothetical protein
VVRASPLAFWSIFSGHPNNNGRECLSISFRRAELAFRFVPGRWLFYLVTLRKNIASPVPPVATKNSVLTETIELAAKLPVDSEAPGPTFLSLFSSLLDSLRSHAALQAEILALRHQFLVLQRANRKHRLRMRALDRVFWVWLSCVWSGWRSALLIVKPATVIAWHRKGFRLYWTWKSRA